MLKTEKGRLKSMGMLASMGMTMVLTTLMGLGLGLYLDKRFDTAPWLMAVFLFFGVAAGFKNIYYVLKKYGFLEDFQDDANGQDSEQNDKRGQDR
jgi:ATP synthase protein I